MNNNYCFQSWLKFLLTLVAVAVILIQVTESGSANLCRGYDCRDGTCVGIGARCDDISQCPDRSDELRCESCDDGFPCDNGECTSSELDRCDGRQDCSDGSDESNCGANLIGVVVGSVMGGMLVFVCCPIVIVVTIVCCVFCCVMGKSPESHTWVKTKGGDAAPLKVPLTTMTTHDVPTTGHSQEYQLQPTASAPPLNSEEDPQPSAPAYSTDPATPPVEAPPPYPGIGTVPVENDNNLKMPLSLR